jgi:hypothetical protein
MCQSCIDGSYKERKRREKILFTDFLKVCKILYHFSKCIMEWVLPSKWCIRVPYTRKQSERTKIIIYVSPSSLYMSACRKREILDSRLTHHFTWQQNARMLTKAPERVSHL